MGMKKTQRNVLIAAIAVLLIAGAAVVYFLNFYGEEVQTVKAKETELVVTVNGPGKVGALSKTEVFPELAGIIDEIYVEDGAHVVAGQEVLRLKEEPLKLQLKEAQAALAQAKAARENVDYQKSHRELSISLAESSLDDARQAVKDLTKKRDDLKAQLKDAEEQLNLLRSSNATQGLDVLDDAITDLKAGLARVEDGLTQAKANETLAEQGLKQARNLPIGSQAGSAAQAGIAAAEEAVAVAQKALDNAVLKAPADGTLIYTSPQNPLMGGDPQASYVAGSAVSPQLSIFSVVSNNLLGFKAEIDESSIAEIKEGQEVKVSLDAFADSELLGKVSTVASTASSTLTGGNIFIVEISFNETRDDIKVGMKGDAEITVQTSEKILSIPLNALFSQGKTEFVYRLDGEKIYKTEVSTGIKNDDIVEISSGLKAGDSVVLAGEIALEDGMTVRASSTK